MRFERFLFIASITALTACDDNKPKNHYSLREVIDVQGTCAEDHVGRQDRYAGEIVRWQTVETGAIDVYGSVTITADWTQRAFDRVRRPNVYQTPFMVSFWSIDVDTDQPRWVLHGISNHGDDHSESYETTCQLEVVKRGSTLGQPPGTGDVAKKPR
jgi:hypothetical protein